MQSSALKIGAGIVKLGQKTQKRRNKCKQPYKHWKLVVNQRDKLNTIAELYNVKQLDDWYAITRRDCVYSGGSSIIKLCAKTLFRLIVQ
jgi:hypothetical protein